MEEGPFDQGRAERFARMLLMPGEELLTLVGESDATLAEWFGVPVEHVPLRRAKLRLPTRGLGAAP
jgi:Zn-dependent peptidase ImmA (M78 family)